MKQHHWAALWKIIFNLFDFVTQATSLCLGQLGLFQNCANKMISSCLFLEADIFLNSTMGPAGVASCVGYAKTIFESSTAMSSHHLTKCWEVGILQGASLLHGVLANGSEQLRETTMRYKLCSSVEVPFSIRFVILRRGIAEETKLLCAHHEVL